MTIEELIKQLEEIKKEYGNIEVRVQYRDDGGHYFGNDTNIELAIDTENEEESVLL